MNKFVLDTSFICSFLNESDANHKKATQAYQAFNDDSKFIIPRTVILELINLGEKFAETKEFLNSLSTEIIDIDEKFTEQFKNLQTQLSTNLKTIDKTIFATAITAQAQIISFDKKIIAAAQKHILSK
jgi:predicted nucleic-acid-binding protein